MLTGVLGGTGYPDYNGHLAASSVTQADTQYALHTSRDYITYEESPNPVGGCYPRLQSERPVRPPFALSKALKPSSMFHEDHDQGPRIGWKLGWGVENSASKCAVRVENQHQKYENNVETLARKLCSQNRLP